MRGAAERITLIIPTRDRAETLHYAIQSATSEPDPDLEILVSDNCSNDATPTLVRAVKDPRVRYVNTGRRISLSDNFEFALKHVSPGYVIMIGDDDAVAPGGMARLRRAIEERPSAVYCWPSPIYFWPMGGRPAEFSYPPGTSARDFLTRMPPRALSALDLRYHVRRVVARGGVGSMAVKTLYHGAVATTVIEAIRGRAGRVFPTANPDIFANLVIPAFCPTVTDVGAPVTLQGMSAKSNGGSVRMGGTVQQSAGKTFTHETGDYVLHTALAPELPLPGNLAADTYLVAMDTFPEVFAGATFEHEFFWATMVRAKVLSVADVLRHVGDLRARVPFSRRRFLARIALLEAATARRAMLDHVLDRFPLVKDPAPNIVDASAQLARIHAVS